MCGYGSTEVGAATEASVPDRENLSDWAYVKFSPYTCPRFIPVNDGEDSHELVFLVSQIVRKTR